MKIKRIFFALFAIVFSICTFFGSFSNAIVLAASAEEFDNEPVAQIQNTLPSVSEVAPIANSEEVVYVSNAGSDSATGEQNTPLQTLGAAVSKLSNGGTILVKDNLTLNGTITIDKDITIKSMSDVVTVQRDASFVDRMFVVSKTGSLILENIVFDGNKEKVTFNEADNQIVYVNGGTLTLNAGAVLQNNKTTWSGGAVTVDNGKFFMTGGKITQNEAGYGGGISVGNGSTATLTGGEISSNKTNQYGGGAINAIEGSTLSIENVTMTGNDAANDHGGAIKFKGNSLSIKGGTLSQNKATQGGALWIEDVKTTTIEDTVISNNNATQGGAIWVRDSKAIGSTMTLQGTTSIFGNQTTNGDGGAIWMDSVTLNIQGNTSISKNKTVGKLSEDSGYANVRGGAIFISGKSTVNLQDNARLTENQAPYGGAIYILDSSKLNMTGGEISNNTASVNAGAICAFAYNGAPTVTISKGKIQGNKNTALDVYMNADFISDREFSGGAIYIGEDCSLYLTNVVIHDNHLTQSSRFLDGRESDRGIFAGGIGLCPNSNARFYVTNGGALYNNDGADILFVPNTPKLPIQQAEFFVSAYALGNGAYNWEDLNGNPVAKVGMQKVEENQILSFVSNLSESDSKKASDSAEVIISGNSTEAIYGGGAIMCNGTIQIGTSGDLTVSKEVQGDAGEEDREFHFTVDLHDTNINGTYGDMEFKNGVATFTLKSNESKTASNLPSGTEYTVTEEEANQEGYLTTEEGTTGIIEGGETQEAHFVNERSVGDLTVSKEVTGEDDSNKEFHFTVELDDPTVNGTYGDMEFKDGVANFTLKNGETKTATGLVAGVAYTVSELEADQNGYQTTVINESGVVASQQETQVTFVNHKLPENPNTEDSVGKSVILFMVAMFLVASAGIVFLLKEKTLKD